METTQKYDPSTMAKDEVYDLVSQIFHDTAAVWQFFDQGDVEDALNLLASIRGRCVEIEVIAGECLVPQSSNAAEGKEGN